MSRYENTGIEDVSEGVLEQPFLGNPNRQADGVQAKALGSAGGKSLTEKVGEEIKPISEGYHENASWLRRNLNNLKGVYNKNQEGVALLIAGTLTDIATTCLVLSSQYGEELNSIPKQIMASLGTGYGQLILKTGVIGAYTLASVKLGPILDGILKSKTATEKLFAYAGYTLLGVSALNLISYMGGNL